MSEDNRLGKCPKCKSVCTLDGCAHCGTGKWRRPELERERANHDRTGESLRVSEIEAMGLDRKLHEAREENERLRERVRTADVLLRDCAGRCCNEDDAQEWLAALPAGEALTDTGERSASDTGGADDNG